MTTYRAHHNHGDFFTMAKEAINDESLSFRAKGILAYIISHADNWQVQLTDLVKHGSEGYGAIRTALNELESAGYIVRKRYRSKGGKFEWVHEVYETAVQESKRSDPEKRKTGPRDKESQPVDENPQVVEPQVDNPQVETCQILSSNDVSNNECDGKSKNDLRTPTPQPLPGLPVPSKKQRIPRDIIIALADVCKVNLSLATTAQKHQVTQSAKLLHSKANADAESVRQFGAWWYANDWRGKRKQPPTPSQVRDVWPQFETTHTQHALEIPQADIEARCTEFFGG